ncbi:type II toxin-antitoxin system RelE/ParE family toxin [Thauera sp. AutoDN2]|uniref:type II toxin-antitoxin system RelE/ParE family toxin n=1 Tax=Thauera sp. AutoDN2 TaxID=3416051 RepID=UPI003F4B76BC
MDQERSRHPAEGHPRKQPLKFQTKCSTTLEQAYTHIARHPGTGSPRFGHELDLPGLRSWVLSGYPYLVFYVERPDHIDVWRVLHGQRDIPSWMQDQEGFV